MTIGELRHDLEAAEKLAKQLHLYLYPTNENQVQDDFSLRLIGNAADTIEKLITIILNSSIT